MSVEFNREKCSEIWTDLNRRLKHIERTDGGLGAALEALSHQQRDHGFIQDDLAFSSHEEGQRLEFGRIDYHTIERILAAVRFN